MRSEGLFEMNGIKKLNFIEVHTCKKNDLLLINKYDIILFQLLNLVTKSINEKCSFVIQEWLVESEWLQVQHVKIVNLITWIFFKDICPKLLSITENWLQDMKINRDMRWWNKAIQAIPVLFFGWCHTANSELLRKPVHSDISLTTWANGGVCCRNLQSQVYLLSGFVKLNLLELLPDVLLDWKSKEYKNWNYKSQWHAGASKDIMSISRRTDLNQKKCFGH